MSTRRGLMKSAANIRKDARESLKGKWKKVVLITLVYFIVPFIFIIILKKCEEVAFRAIIILIITIIEVPISFGLSISFMKLKRGEEVGTFDLFKDGFSNLKRAYGLVWYVGIKMIIPVILMYISGGLIVSFGWVFLIALLIRPSTVPALVLIVLIISFILSTVYVVIKGLTYSMSYLIACDNIEMSTKDAVEKSKELMRGNKRNLFIFRLSFIVWRILTIFTLGIGCLWLMPYIQVATICFYEELANKND